MHCTCSLSFQIQALNKIKFLKRQSSSGSAVFSAPMFFHDFREDDANLDMAFKKAKEKSKPPPMSFIAVVREPVQRFSANLDFFRYGLGQK